MKEPHPCFLFLIRIPLAWLPELCGSITTSAETAGERDKKKCWWEFLDHKLFSPQLQELSFQPEIQACFGTHGFVD